MVKKNQFQYRHYDTKIFAALKMTWSAIYKVLSLYCQHQGGQKGKEYLKVKKKNPQNKTFQYKSDKICTRSI